jgi:hypothetical protein
MVTELHAEYADDHPRAGQDEMHVDETTPSDTAQFRDTPDQ